MSSPASLTVDRKLESISFGVLCRCDSSCWSQPKEPRAPRSETHWRTSAWALLAEYHTCFCQLCSEARKDGLSRLFFRPSHVDRVELSHWSVLWAFLLMFRRSGILFLWEPWVCEISAIQIPPALGYFGWGRCGGAEVCSCAEELNGHGLWTQYS